MFICVSLLLTKNCIVLNNTDDFSGCTVSYCCSDDGDGSYSQSPAAGGEFTNLQGEDYSLVSGANSINTATDDPGSGLYSDDIMGTARSSPWDIGAFEFVSGIPISVLAHQHSMMAGAL